MSTEEIEEVAENEKNEANLELEKYIFSILKQMRCTENKLE